MIGPAQKAAEKLEKQSANYFHTTFIPTSYFNTSTIVYPKISKTCIIVDASFLQY